jgi:PIN domain nuclease of toxin-antitoxin system
LTEEQGFIILDLTPKQLDTYRTFHSANTDPVDNALLTIAETNRFHFLTADQKVIPLNSSYPWIIAA